MMFDVMRVAAALVTLTAFGYAITLLVAREMPFQWFERVGFAYVLGIGAASLVWLVLTPAYGLVSPVILISAVAWITTTIVVSVPAKGGYKHGAGSGTSRTDSTQSTESSRWTHVLLVVLAVELLALTAASLRSGLGFDAVFNFEIKARLAFENAVRGQIPLAYFGDESIAWSHPRYPLLVPFAEFWVYAWLGRVDQAFAKILFPLYYVALVCVTGGTVRRIAGSAAALLTVIALGTLPAMTVIPGASSGYAEIPLAAALVGAVCCALIAVRTGDRHMVWMAGYLSATVVWTKAEGIVLSMCLGLAGAALIGRKALPLIVMPLAVFVPWLVFQHLYGVPEKDFPSLSPLVALSHLDRAGTIAQLVVRELVTPGHWGMLWPAFAVLWLADLSRRSTAGAKADEASSMLAALVIVPLCVYPAIYLFSSWSDVEGHVRTSFIRLLVPIAPIALIFSASRLQRALS